MTAEISSTSRPVDSARRCRTASAAGQIGLGDDDNLRAAAEFGVVQLQFRADRAIVGQRIGAVGRLGLDEMDQDARPLDVPQELVAQPDALVGAFDQPGNVGHDERAVEVDLHPAEVAGAWW